MLRNRSLSVLVRMHGGACYREEEHARAFDSLAEAKRLWERRRDTGGVFRCEDTYYPNWGDPSVFTARDDGRYHAAYAFLVDYDELSDMHDDWCPDPYQPVFNVEGMFPDYELTVGPRGGLRWERC